MSFASPTTFHSDESRRGQSAGRRVRGGWPDRAIWEIRVAASLGYQTDVFFLMPTAPMLAGGAHLGS